MNTYNLLAIFTTGLLTGGLTCMAVQGGLLAATIAQREEEHLKSVKALKRRDKALPLTSFLLAKLIAYTVLGALLGWFGSFFNLSLSTQVILQLMVAVFMIATAFNILNVHPIFRYVVIQPPKFVRRFLRQESKSKDIFAPALLGAFTVLIPCGTTQAMMALSVGSGSPLTGSLILFSFVLGTIPVFFALGYFATTLSGMWMNKFMRLAAFAIILLAVFNIDNAVALSGSNLTLKNITHNTYCTFALCDDSVVFAYNRLAAQAVTSATITIEDSGYYPRNLVVKAGSPVTLHFYNKDGGGCTQAFTIPQLGLQKIVPLGKTADLQFTAPDKPQDLAFMCSMGMYRGTIKVI